MIPQCEEYNRLLGAYTKSLDLYSAALTALKEARPTTTKEEYKRLLGYVQQARTKSEEARLAWEVHRNQHGC